METFCFGEWTMMHCSEILRGGTRATVIRRGIMDGKASSQEANEDRLLLLELHKSVEGRRGEKPREEKETLAK